MTVRIRRAGVGDVATLAGFNAAMALESEGKTLDHDLLERGVSHLLRNPDEGHYLVAEKDAAVVGALLVTFEWSDWRDGRFWWIQSVFVAAEHRRQGVYSALHGAIRAEARTDPQGCGLRLYVEKDNAGAMATYRHLGMHETDYRLYEEEF